MKRKSFIDEFLVDYSDNIINYIKNRLSMKDTNIRKYIKTLEGKFTIENYEKYLSMQHRMIYDIEWNMCKYSISKERAIDKINQLKDKTKGSLDNFINRYGYEEGMYRWNQFRGKSKHTKEKFIEKYGEIEGINKWNEYLKKKSLSCKKKKH